MTNDVLTREWSKDVMTPQNPLGVAGWTIPEEDEDDVDEVEEFFQGSSKRKQL